ncbi:hypothetical protein KSF_075040 [Reticulibacter mediterranei]|uniref:Uncharacterized protein n=2 Tax=Reticulibacter mediterranei TaxID=2778369 RepID=A0A8J3IWQ5_9CHLR|nr:hypothetical protein KSF_075040 [Reticulibacter mediterranei]
MNSLREPMIQSKGKIARVRHGLLHFAEVELTVSSADEMVVTFDCHGEGFISQGYIEVVPAKGYDDWKHGALAGITYALGKCSDHPCNVTVTYIAGLTTDTNPSIVGGAAIQAIWSALQYEPTAEEQTHIEKIVFQSFTQPFDHVPDFGS